MSAKPQNLLVLITDFGIQDPYLGQMQAAIHAVNPSLQTVNLFSGLKNYDVQLAAYLIPAYVETFPEGSVFVCVVDPGVGGERLPVAIKIENHWYVGPDNGLFSILIRRAKSYEAYQIHWRPAELSNSFHGRDLFAPVAARLASGIEVDIQTCQIKLNQDWPEELEKIVYIDHYGNLISGIRAKSVDSSAVIEINGCEVGYAPYFSAVSHGELFWYENANGLLEIAANQSSAKDLLKISVGQSLRVKA